MRKNTFVGHPPATKLEAKMHPKAVQEQQKSDFFGVRFSNGVFNDFRCPPAPPGTENQAKTLEGCSKTRFAPLTKKSLRRGVRGSILERFWLPFRRHLGTKVEKNRPGKDDEKKIPKSHARMWKSHASVCKSYEPRGGGSPTILSETPWAREETPK